FQTLNSRTLTVSVSASQARQTSDYVTLPERQTLLRGEEISFIANRLMTESRFWGDASVLTAEGLCLEWLAATAKEQSNANAPPDWLRGARDMLHDRCREPLTISAIAAEVGVHPVHLTRTFRKFFHSTPGEYLRNRRIEIAASILRKGKESLAQAALDSGFSD